MSVVTGLTEQQMKWAKQHDWFGSSYKLAAHCHEVTCFTVEIDKAGLVQEVTATFTDFQELRAWAGY